MQSFFKPITLFFICCFTTRLYAQQPILKVDGKDSASVLLQTYHVDVKVVGNTAITTMEMQFCNNSNRVLEGTLDFPMPDGVTVSRYAIDINGKMREAVPVEKEKGQVVFENIERKNVDPGLLEKTEGNNFRTRIYPIPAKGCRKVLIGYERELKMTNNTALLYDLPLHFKKAIKDFSITFRIYSVAAPETGKDCTADMRFSEMKNVYVSETKKTNYKPDANYSIIIPKFPDAAEVLMQQVNGQYYFMLNSYPEARKIEKNIPDNIGIIWDVSLSGTNRNHAKEFELLDLYFKKKGNLSVQLTTIGYEMKNAGSYRVNAGNWDELKKNLEKITYDGGTDLSKINGLPSAGEYLLFSDGLNTCSTTENLSRQRIPVISINAAPNADYPLLKYIAAGTGGTFINLNELPVEVAGNLLTSQQLQLIGVKTNSNVSDIYPSIATPVAGNCAIAGICNSTTATITLQYGFGKTVSFEKTIELDFNQQQTNNIDLQKIWAQKKINQLETQYETFKDMITDIGKKYGLVTRNTSLIVLDAVADYVQYEIEPPVELMPEYNRLSKLKMQKEKLADKRSIDEAVNYYGKLTAWWNRKFPAKRFKYLEDKVGGVTTNSQLASANGSTTYLNVLSDSIVANRQAMTAGIETATFAFTSSRQRLRTVRAGSYSQGLASHYTTSSEMYVSASPFLRIDSNAPAAGRNYRRTNTAGYLNEQAPLQERAQLNTVSNLSSADSTRGNDSPMYDSLGTIETFDTTAFQKPYLKQLDSASKENVYEKYLEIRKEYIENPVFFFDVAKRFFANGDTATGLQILSNIADLGFDDHELYKMLGYQLKVLRQFEKEVFVYKKVLQWRPQDPQSYRDYALALADNRQYQNAIDTLYLSLTKNFDAEISSLYPGIEEITATDINNIIVQHGNGLDLSKIDRRVIKNLPVDVRVVLNWNMNDTDIDLWVIDPNGEKCFYSHTLTTIGGRISHDFTRGYGPEQFLLKKALTGKYKVMLNYYGDTQQKIAGPTTVMAEIFTNYGKPNQQSKTISIQMQKAGRNEVLVGEFEF